ncbi:hypothetical protein V8C86DRAFT_2780909 [Haematococcus lacustris]
MELAAGARAPSAALSDPALTLELTDVAAGAALALLATSATRGDEAAAPVLGLPVMLGLVTAVELDCIRVAADAVPCLGTVAASGAFAAEVAVAWPAGLLAEDEPLVAACAGIAAVASAASLPATSASKPPSVSQSWPVWSVSATASSVMLLPWLPLSCPAEAALWWWLWLPMSWASFVGACCVKETAGARAAINAATLSPTFWTSSWCSGCGFCCDGCCFSVLLLLLV